MSGRLRLCIAEDHAALAGHFPGMPVVPGAVVQEEELYAIERAPELSPEAAAPDAEAPAPWRIRCVKFHHAAPPGQTLQLDYQALAEGGTQFELRHADTLIASGAVERSAPSASAPSASAAAPAS